MSSDVVQPFLQVGERKIGSDEPVFVIAEAGINHNGSIERAKELIDAAASAGADAVKFQKRNLAEVYEAKLLKNPNSGEQKYAYLIPLLKEFELPDEAYPELEAYAASRGIMFLVNPWDVSSADAIERLLNIPVYKIGSPDMTNDELLEHVAGFKKPMILSTGMSTEEEIEHVVELMRRLGVSFALLHCNNTYPAPFDEINLRYMDTLARHGVPVGYSGHERGTAVSIGAVARGACIIERHLTVDRGLEGPDHKASLLPDEFKQLVTGIREVETARGQAVKKLSRAEIMNREALAKSIVARVFIPDGTVITREMLTTRSPAKGLSPQRMEAVVGITAQRDIFAGDPLTEDDLAAAVTTTFDPAGIAWQWGPVVRFHDFEQYLKYKPNLFEFHLSDKDLDEAVPKGSWEQAAVVHAPEYMHRTYLNPASENPEERQLAVATLQRSIDVARRLGESFTGGMPKFVVHPGGITLERAADPGRLLDLFGDTLSKLKTDGVLVLPENLPPRPWVFGGEWVTNIFMLADEIEPWLKERGYFMCFDTSHAALAAAYAGRPLVDEVQRLKPYIRHLHVADGAGVGDEGLQIGSGAIDFAAVLKPLSGYQHTMVPEIWQGHLHGGRGFLHAMEHLKPYMR